MENSGLNSQVNTMKPSDDEIDILEILGILFSHWKILTLFTVVGLIAGLFFACYSRNIYKSDVMLQLDLKAGGAQAMVEMGALFDTESPAETEIRIIKSRQILSKVVKQEHLMYKATPVNFLDRLKGTEGRMDLSLFQVPKQLESEESKWIAIVTGVDSYTLYTPKGTELLKGKVHETYRIPYAGDSILIAVDFLDAEEGQAFLLTTTSLMKVVNALKEKLEVQEDGKKTNIILMTYEHRYPDKAASILNTIAETYVKQNVEMRSAEAEKTLEFLEAQLPAIKKTLDSSEQVLTEYRKRVGTVDLTAESKVTLDRQVQLRSQLLALEQERQEMSRLYKEDHPTMQAIISKQERLNREIAKEEYVVSKLPITQQEVIKLQQNVEINNQLYTSILNNIQQLRVVRAGEIGNVRIVDTAYAAERPIKPKKWMIVGIALFAGFALGCLLVFLKRMLLEKGVASSTEIEQVTQTSVYAKIPKTILSKEMLKQSKQNPRFILAQADQNLRITEQLRVLRTSLEFSFFDKNLKVLLVSGLVPNAGKTFISLNLAYLTTQLNKKVLVIDTDFRNSYLSNGKDNGLSDVLYGKVSFADAVQKLENTDVDFLSVGRKITNPSELLASEEFKALIETEKANYDLIVLDSAPIGEVTDAQILARFSDFALLVLLYKKHSMEHIQESLKLLDQVGLSKRAFILNKCYYDGSSNGYGYGYGYGYGHRNKKERK